jgi:competence protein ComEA
MSQFTLFPGILVAFRCQVSGLRRRAKFFSRDQQVIALLLGLIIFFTGLFRLFHPFCSILSPTPADLTIKPRLQSIVEVAGAVKHPGIYTFDEPPTACQAIRCAGGPTRERPLSFDTPAHTIDTGMRVELQASNAACADLIITPISFSQRVVLGIPIALSQARVDDLAMIPGMGQALAHRIVEFRESHGPFKTWNDLMGVNGIGPAKIKSFRPYLDLK